MLGNRGSGFDTRWILAVFLFSLLKFSREKFVSQKWHRPFTKRTTAPTTRLSGIRSVHQDVLEVSVAVTGNQRSLWKKCSSVRTARQDGEIAQQDSRDSSI